MNADRHVKEDPVTTPQDDGGPAFPAGMSMRDWFASMYMIGEVARGRRIRFHELPDLALRAYEAAEAMLSEREGRMAADAETGIQPPA